MMNPTSHYRRRWRLVLTLSLFFLALGVRAWRAWQTPVVNPDAIRFVQQAQRLARDPILAVRTEVYHPLHSLAGLGVHQLIGRFFPNERLGWLVSLQVVGVLCGALVAVEIFALARRMGAPAWTSLGASAVWIVGRRTSAYGADGISDMLFLSLFGAAMIIGIDAMRFRRPYLTVGRGGAFFLAGVLVGFAYLTRPEGLAAPLILSLALLLPFILRQPPVAHCFKLMVRPRTSLPTACIAIAWLLAGTALVAAPYMTAIGGLTMKKPLSTPSITPVAASVGVSLDRFLPSIEKAGMEIWETFGFAPTITLVLAMLFTPWFWGRPRLRLVTIVWTFLWVGIMFWLMYRANYLDGRHTLPLQLILHGLLALAFLYWQRPMRWYMSFWQKRRVWSRFPAWMKSPRWPAIVSACAIFLAMLPGLIMLSTPPSEDRRFLLDASKWVASHLRSNVLVYEKSLLVGYYSGHPFQRIYTIMPGDGPDSLRPQSFPHVIVITYLTDEQSHPPLNLGPYVAISAFSSGQAAHGDVLVIYALPQSDIMKTGEIVPLIALPIHGRTRS